MNICCVEVFIWTNGRSLHVAVALVSVAVAILLVGSRFFFRCAASCLSFAKAICVFVFSLSVYQSTYRIALAFQSIDRQTHTHTQNTQMVRQLGTKIDQIK